MVNDLHNLKTAIMMGWRGWGKRGVQKVKWWVLLGAMFVRWNQGVKKVLKNFLGSHAVFLLAMCP